MSRRAKHRAPIVQTYYLPWQYRYWMNRYYLVGRPKMRKLLKRIGLRK